MAGLKLSGDYKKVDGFVMFTKSREVYAENGRFLGVLPDGSFPHSGVELLARLKQPKKIEQPKEAEVKAEAKAEAKKGLSLDGLKKA